MKKLLLALILALSTPTFAQSPALSNVAKLRALLVVTDQVYSGGAKGDGATDDSAAFTTACAAAASKTLIVPAGTYKISNNVTCGSTVQLLLLNGAQISVDVGKVFTANGQVVSLGGTPNTGAGTFTLVHKANVIANAFGFGVGTVAPSNTDDALHFEYSLNSSHGINVKNQNTGALADAYLHMWGGAQDVSGSDIRIAAQSSALGGNVNFVAKHNTGAGWMNFIEADAKPISFFTNNTEMMRLISSAAVVNRWQFHGGATGSSINVASDGTDADISITYDTKGAGSHFFRTAAGAENQLEVSRTASATRRVVITGSNGGNPSISASAGALAIGTAAIQLTGFTFANIGTTLTANGMIGYCSDCTIANPCAGAGTGALAKRLNGVNVCN